MPKKASSSNSSSDHKHQKLILETASCVSFTRCLRASAVSAVLTSTLHPTLRPTLLSTRLRKKMQRLTRECRAKAKSVHSSGLNQAVDTAQFATKRIPPRLSATGQRRRKHAHSLQKHEILRGAKQKWTKCNVNAEKWRQQSESVRQRQHLRRQQILHVQKKQGSDHGSNQRWRVRMWSNQIQSGGTTFSIDQVQRTMQLPWWSKLNSVLLNEQLRWNNNFTNNS